MRKFETIPVVDISGLFSERLDQRRKAAAALGEAARNVGFLYVVGHRVPRAAVERMEAAARAFFARPLDFKMRSYIGLSHNHSGYAPQGEETTAGGKPGKKESFDFGLEYEGPDKRPMLGPNLWPDDPQFRQAALAYYREMSRLAHRLFAGFALALGLPEDHFEAVLSAAPSQQRMLHYPFDPDAEDREGVGAHTDYECFTILATSAPGLQVMDDTGRWVDAPPLPGAFVINIGEMMEIWTNGAFVATTHRVRAVKEERYSFPFFAAPDYDTVVAPLPAFITPERPAKYEKVVAGDHLFAKTIETFRYLQDRLARGEIALPAYEGGEFGRTAAS